MHRPRPRLKETPWVDESEVLDVRERFYNNKRGPLETRDSRLQACDIVITPDLFGSS